MELPFISVNHNDIVAIRVICGRGNAIDLHHSPRRPCSIIFHIPRIELGGGGAIHQRAGQRNLQNLNGNRAGCALGGILYRGCRDRGSAIANTGNRTVFVHGSHIRIVAGPGHRIGMDAERRNFRLQRRRAALEKLQRAAIQGNRNRIIQLRLVQIDLVGTAVVCVVIYLQQQMCCICCSVCIQRHGNSLAAACSLRRTARPRKDFPGRVIVQHRCCNISVVGGRNGHDPSVVDQVLGKRNVGQRRSSLVNKHRIGLTCSLTKRIPIRRKRRAAVIHIILRRHGKLHSQLFAFRGIRRTIHGQAALHLHPRLLVREIVGANDRSLSLLVEIYRTVLAGHSDPAIGRISDQAEINIRDLCGIRVDGVTICIVESVVYIQISAKGIGVIHAFVFYGQRLELRCLLNCSEHVGRTGLHAVVILNKAADIKHGGIGPISVVAQHRDRMAGPFDTLFTAYLVGKYITLDISACTAVLFVVAVQTKNLCMNRDVNLSVCRHRHGSTAQAGEEQVSIIGIDVSVLIQIRTALAADLGPHAGHIVQQRLTVIRGYLAASVKVAAVQLRRHFRLQRFPIYVPDNVCG